jgi:hypothetical protein
MKRIQISTLFLIAVVLMSCGEYAEKETFYIPQGFTGTVAVIFDQKDGAPKEYNEGRRIYRIPRNGVLYTTLHDVKGVLDQKYFYVNAAGEPSQELPSLPLPILEDDNYDSHKIYVMSGFDGTFHKNVRFIYKCVGYVSQSDSLISAANKLIDQVDRTYPNHLK